MSLGTDLVDAIDEIADASSFSGAVRVDHEDQTLAARAYGFAHRGWGIANAVDTRFGIASGTKGLTALSIVSLIEDGRLELSTTARSVLGADLPLVDDGVTVEHLLAHRSGMGDYLDEAAGYDVNDYVMPVPVHQLATTADYLAVIDGHAAQFPPGERFAYNNGAYVLLALIAERVSGLPFPDLVGERVCTPAGMVDTAFTRSDELPTRTATGYLTNDPRSRTNVLHLPVQGTGDGGIYSTVADLHSFWTALFEGRVVSAEWVVEMVRVRSEVPDDRMRYGLGFWLSETDATVVLTGHDPGVSFRSSHDPTRRLTWTVVGNTSDGAWPLARRLDVLARA